MDRKSKAPLQRLRVASEAVASEVQLVPVLKQKRKGRRSLPPRLEKDVRDPVVAYAKSLGAMHERNHKGAGAAAGFPDDRFYFGKGHSYLVEFKRPGGKLSALQKMTIKRLQDSGHDVDVWDNSDKACEAILRRMAFFGRPSSGR